jgi:hypothetical protein
MALHHLAYDPKEAAVRRPNRATLRRTLFDLADGITFCVFMFLSMFSLGAVSLFGSACGIAIAGITFAVIGLSPYVVRGVMEKRSEELKREQRLRNQYPSAAAGPLAMCVTVVAEAELIRLTPSWQHCSSWTILASAVFALVVSSALHRDAKKVYPPNAMRSPSKMWFHSVCVMPLMLSMAIGVTVFFQLDWSRHGLAAGIALTAIAVAWATWFVCVTKPDRRRDIFSPLGAQNVVCPAHGEHDWETGFTTALKLDPSEAERGKVRWQSATPH